MCLNTKKTQVQFLRLVERGFERDGPANNEPQLITAAGSIDKQLVLYYCGKQKMNGFFLKKIPTEYNVVTN